MYIKKLHGPVIADLDKPVAETTSGKVRGLITNGTYIFRSIRYGEAERFHQPRRVTPWEGIDPCISYKGVCPELDGPVSRDNFYLAHMWYRYDENCLHLNVWTKSMDKDAKRPVMVWLHGGGYTMGSAIELYSYDGENLCNFGDVVVVSVNHRLNVLGYLDLSAYGEEYANSGNAGISDLVEALRWIKDNIATFGGDPNNVMLFGQSGGGGKILNLMQTPAADGLYHKVSVQSGIMQGPGMAGGDQKDSRALADLVLKHAGLPCSREGAKALETLPIDELIKAANAAIAEASEGGKFVHFAPVKNEFMLGSQLVDGFRRENLNVPMIVGSVFGEFISNTDKPEKDGTSKNWWDEETKLRKLHERFGEKTDSIIEAFRQAYPKKNIADLLYLDTNCRRGIFEYADRRAEVATAPIYTYLFTLEHAFNSGSIAFHGAELAYVFHNADYLEACYIPDVTEKLQDQVAAAWVNFARTGNPSGGLAPDWEPVHDHNGATMVYDEEAACLFAHDRELMNRLPPSGRIVVER